MIPPSRFNFRRHSGDGGDGSPLLRMVFCGKIGMFFIDALLMHSCPSSHSSIPGPSEMAKGPSSSHQTERRNPKPLSTEGSIIPGETEGDGLLCREYVLVGDTRGRIQPHNRWRFAFITSSSYKHQLIYAIRNNLRAPAPPSRPEDITHTHN
jgi:hypothetical protein